MNGSVGTLVRLAEGGANITDPEWCECEGIPTRATANFTRYRWQPYWEECIGYMTWVPLAVAAAHGQTDVVDYLLTQGADMNTTGIGICDCRCLCYLTCIAACFDRRTPWVRELGRKRAKFPQELTPLHVAVCSGHLSTVKLLLDRGADPRSVNTSPTALHLAIDMGHRHIVEYLLRNKIVGVDDSNEEFPSYTALHIAYLEGYHDIVDLLLEEGANVNAQFSFYETDLWTVFALACASNDLKSALKFLRAGADPDFVIRWQTYHLEGRLEVPWTAMSLICQFKLPDDDVERKQAAMCLRMEVEKEMFAAVKRKALAEISQAGEQGEVEDKEHAQLEGTAGKSS